MSTQSGMRWNNDFDKFQMHLRALGPKMHERCEAIVRKAVNDGAQIMRSHIQTRGTGYRGHRGRIETGKMLNDVGASDVSRSRNTFNAEFGWNVKGGTSPAYYRFQENGFRHWRSGKDIPPLHALLDAYATVRRDFEAEILRMVRGQ